jgi:hypothetical protein
MSTFRFLHLTDLHLGMAGQAPLWPNVEEIFFADLKTLLERVGPWDLVLCEVRDDCTDPSRRALFVSRRP